MIPGIYDLDAKTYHADPCDAASFSASLGKLLLDQSPAHAFLAHPKLGGQKKEDEQTPAMRFGNLVHSIVLGKGRDATIVEAPTWQTNAAKAARAEADAAGRLAILRHHYDQAILAQSAFWSQLAANREEDSIFNLGQSEQVAVAEFANLQGDGRVWARGMIDRLTLATSDGRAHIRDIKTTADCSEHALDSRITDGRMAMQLACYEWLIETLLPQFRGRVTSKLYFLETEPPFSLVIVELDDAWRQIGRLQLGRAWDSWQRCIATGYWPSFQSGTTTLVGPPAWLLSQEMDDIQTR
jgi:hypothetical protein